MTRLISEAAVIALVQGKIDAANETANRLETKENPTPRDVKRADDLHAKVSALQTVILHLRFIDTSDIEMDLQEVRTAISEVNRNAGETIFNPAATQALEGLMSDDPAPVTDGAESAMCPFTCGTEYGGEFPIVGQNA
jgi:hypothetical protein